MKDEVYFLPANKCQRLLQIDSILLGVRGMPKLPKVTSLLFLCNILRRKLIFLHADKQENFLQIDTKNLMGMIKHSQSSQNRKSAMSLQYFKKS